jgi:5-methylcytosine-specific restriction endonuclease McrA
MPRPTCLDCGVAFTPTLYRQRRCLDHEPRGRVSRSPTTQAQDGEYLRNRALVLTDDPTCHWCPRPATTADHLVAVAAGGSNQLSNLVPACKPCNSSRGAGGWA